MIEIDTHLAIYYDVQALRHPLGVKKLIESHLFPSSLSHLRRKHDQYATERKDMTLV